MNLVARILSIILPFLLLLPFGLSLWNGPTNSEFRYFLVAFCIATAVSIFLGLRITRHVIRPLQALKEQIREFPTGKTGPMPRSPVIEIADLISGMHAIMEQLQSNIQGLTIEKEILGSLLNGLREGVLCMDGDGTILFQSSSIDSELVEGKSEGKLYFKQVRNPDMLEFMREQLKDQQDAKEQAFEIGNKYFTVACRTVSLQGQPPLFLFIVQDHTEEQNTRRLREDFLQNASHELRTPITSVRGYAETILKKATGTLEQGFLSAILRNVERMERLIEDMLTISRVESRSLPFQPATVDPFSYMQEIQVLVEGLLTPRRQILKIECVAGFKFVADPVLLEHLLLNLIANASRYSGEEGTITVRFSEHNAGVMIEVLDQGPGVSPEVQEKIFERFFRADHNRSRAEGGSGLGLSIVRQIARVHGGTVSVENRPSGGAHFIVQLPQTNQIDQ